MEITILIKYGISEEISIDITKDVLTSYFNKNIINISSKELETFTSKFYTSWLNKHINLVIERAIDPRILIDSQKIFINLNNNLDTSFKTIKFVANINNSTNIHINLAKICKKKF